MDQEVIPLAQKCSRCGHFLLQSQEIIPDPKRKYWYAHANCVQLFMRKRKNKNKLKTFTTSVVSE